MCGCRHQQFSSVWQTAGSVGENQYYCLHSILHNNQHSHRVTVSTPLLFPAWHLLCIRQLTMVRTARGEGESMRAGTQADKQEVTKLIQHCLSLQQVRDAGSDNDALISTCPQGTEFGRQIKRLFSHHSLWLASAAIIVLVGIPLDLPVVAVSAAVFMSMFFFNKVSFYLH